MRSTSKSLTAMRRQASWSALRPSGYDENGTMLQGLVISNPQPNPKSAWRSLGENQRTNYAWTATPLYR